MECIRWTEKKTNEEVMILVKEKSNFVSFMEVKRMVESRERWRSFTDKGPAL